MAEKKAADQQAEISRLQAAIKEKDQEIEELEQQLDQAEQQIEKLEGRKPSALPVVELNGVEYTVLAGRFRLGRDQYTTADLVEKPELVKRVLSIKGQKILEPVKKA